MPCAVSWVCQALRRRACVEGATNTYREEGGGGRGERGRMRAGVRSAAHIFFPRRYSVTKPFEPPPTTPPFPKPMTGANYDIIAQGLIDKSITGNPQVTHWRSVWKRYARFGHGVRVAALLHQHRLWPGGPVRAQPSGRPRLPPVRARHAPGHRRVRRQDRELRRPRRRRPVPHLHRRLGVRPVRQGRRGRAPRVPAVRLRLALRRRPGGRAPRGQGRVAPREVRRRARELRLRRRERRLPRRHLPRAGRHLVPLSTTSATSCSTR